MPTLLRVWLGGGEMLLPIGGVYRVTGSVAGLRKTAASGISQAAKTKLVMTDATSRECVR